MQNSGDEMNSNQIKTIAIFATLAALMAATRDHHFCSALHLPDASLAIFLLAGFYLPRWAFPVLLVEAGLADYLAINYGGGGRSGERRGGEEGRDWWGPLQLKKK